MPRPAARNDSASCRTGEGTPSNAGPRHSSSTVVSNRPWWQGRRWRPQRSAGRSGPGRAVRVTPRWSSRLAWCGSANRQARGAHRPAGEPPAAGAAHQHRFTGLRLRHADQLVGVHPASADAHDDRIRVWSVDARRRPPAGARRSVHDRHVAGVSQDDPPLGPKITLMSGALVLACSYGFAALLHTQLWQLLVCTALVGSGIGLAYGAMPSLVMDAVPAGQTAAANSLNNLCRSLGTSTAGAVAGLLLATGTTTVSGRAVPDPAAFTTVLLVGASAALLALFVAAFIPDRRADGVSCGRDGGGSSTRRTCSASEVADRQSSRTSGPGPSTEDADVEAAMTLSSECLACLAGSGAHVRDGPGRVLRTAITTAGCFPTALPGAGRTRSHRAPACRLHQSAPDRPDRSDTASLAQARGTELGSRRCADHASSPPGRTGSTVAGTSPVRCAGRRRADRR